MAHLLAHYGYMGWSPETCYMKFSAALLAVRNICVEFTCPCLSVDFTNVHLHLNEDDTFFDPTPPSHFLQNLSSILFQTSSMDFEIPHDSPMDDTGFGPIVDSPSPPLCFDEGETYQSSQSCRSIRLLRNESSPLDTFAYYRTTLNRISADDLERQGRFNTHQWTPLFVTSALQLPDTLAYVLRYSSGITMSEYMIPGTSVGDEHEKGMVVFGRGRRNRDMISEWYGEGAVCVDVDVEILLADGVVRQMAALRWVEECSSSDTDGRLHEPEEEPQDETVEESDAEEGADDSWISGCRTHAAQVDELGDGHSDSQGWTMLEANPGVVW
ncbi:hypothetical protein K461DRAFT_316879 [Myriangium duriaei CBS 260.36]|uniref:Uncharacterized protein n=1 Tax=Myriangium duriaei CBS 260.36 TaxID=1168546 RepID=A0A9P4MKV6_9PEZI|nr:hypothetical protein K461DRAFT_316879 [Myriangium duriaei CBS 260.36]